MPRARITLASVFLLLLSGARLAAAIPSDELLNSLEPSGDVNDFAGLLSPAEKQALEARCKQLRESTGAQLAVVTLKSLKGGEVEDFANKLFRRWGIGQKDAKNGLLLLVAMEDHRWRLEVGYGLEPIIPDVLAARILDHDLRPRFREMKYAEGLSAAVNSLCEVVERNEPADRAALEAEKKGDGTLFALAFLTIFVVVGALIGGVGAGSRAVPILLFGLVFAGMALAMGMTLAWPQAPMVQVPISLAAFAWGYYVARHGGGTRSGGRRGTSWGGTAWDWGTTSGSSGGGWGGGGGFSQDWGGFGGGSSGGGGASGDW